MLCRPEFEGVVFAALLQQGAGSGVPDFVLRRVDVPGHRYRLADVVQEGSDKDGVGPEVFLRLDHLRLGGQRQRVFLPLVDGVFNHAQGVDDEAAGIGVVVRLRSGEQLHRFAVFGDGLAVHRLKPLRVDRYLAPDATQTVVQAEAGVKRFRTQHRKDAGRIRSRRRGGRAALEQFAQQATAHHPRNSSQLMMTSLGGYGTSEI